MATEKVPFYSLVVGTEFLWLGERFVKVAHSINGEKGFNAAGVGHDATDFFWSQSVTPITEPK